MCPNYDEENDTFEALEHKQELEYERELEIMEELRYEECD